MKTQIKDIVIGIFAVIGFTAVVMGFTNQTETQQEPQQTYGIPESHVWEFHLSDVSSYQFGARSQAFAINKVTGEVRKYETEYSHLKKSPFASWVTAKEQ